MEDSDPLKGKLITAKGNTSATQFKELIQAAIVHFSERNSKAVQTIYNQIKLENKEFTIPLLKESKYTKADGSLDTDLKNELKDLFKDLVNESAKKCGNYQETLENMFHAFLC